MKIYKTTKKELLKKINTQEIFKELNKIYNEPYPIKNSWNGSIPYIYLLLEDERIPNDCGISIEYRITNIDQKKRIDFVITGYNEKREKVMIVIETKQWSVVKKKGDKIGYIENVYNSEEKETPHPSYQAWSYAYILKEYNKIYDDIQIYPCAFLHNYDLKENDIINDKRYKKYIQMAPCFFRGEIEKMQNFICEKIKYGDNKKILELIEKSEASVSSILQYKTKDVLKNSNFTILIDEQKIVYDKTMDMAEQSFKDNKKRVLIVKGGPGTGKTILAIKMLIEFLEKNKTVEYICPVKASREVFSYILKKKDIYKKYAENFRSGSDYIKFNKNEKDVLIIDEAHRLKDKASQYIKEGKNQIKEIINASKFCIFFVDELQRISTRDKGSIEEIRKIAKQLNAQIEELELTSQFRCYGSSGYISWLEDVLQIRNTANSDGFEEKFNYDIKIIDTPNELHKIIKRKNKAKNSSRVVAGYCWNSEKEARNDPNYYDVIIPEYNYKKSWNLQKDYKWAISEGSVEQIGCIYTCLGLEFEYVGVIIGKDLIYRDGKIQIDYTKKAKTDSALYGLKTKLAKKSEDAYKIAEQIIKNTYRTLMTRGQKGCYIFCYDDELKKYLKERIESSKQK